MADVCNLTFESGSLTGTEDSFDSAATNGGNLSVAAGAAMNGTKYGLNCYIANTTAQYGQVDLSASEKRFRHMMWFDPNTLTMPASSALSAAIYIGTAGTTVARWRLVYSSGYKLRLAARLDSGSDVADSDVAITDAPHRVEMDFFIGSAGANDGFATLWLDDVEIASLTGLDNDTLDVNKLRVGAPLGPDADTAGTIYFDGIRLNYTGDAIQQGASGVKHFAGVRLSALRKPRGELNAVRRIW